jgi:gamma-glutamylcyclotransferase (GGCT)/AIG2-like uncharacterized protein YtfP
MVDPKHPVSPIHGEVYGVNEAILARLDLLEGHPDWYRRELIPVRLFNGQIIDAWIYFNPSATGPVILSGNYNR